MENATLTALCLALALVASYVFRLHAPPTHQKKKRQVRQLLFTEMGHERYIAFPDPPKMPVIPQTVYHKQPVPQWLRMAVFERDGWSCRWCGATQDLEVDHVYPERLGGATSMDNLQALCRSCNRRKGARVFS